MPRGGDRGGRRPKLLISQITKSFSLDQKHADKIAELAHAWGCSESEAVRRMVEACQK